MSALREDRGLATLETTLMTVILVPLLFGVIEVGWLFQRWLAAETVAAHAARFAGEVGGDGDDLRRYVSLQLTEVGIDPSRTRLEVDPPRVRWREPIRVSVRMDERIVLPFLFTATVPVSASAVARGEVER